MKLTDEKVAKALGWKKKRHRSNSGARWFVDWFKGERFECSGDDLPAFTTSLDAIVGEIEARGLAFMLSGPHNFIKSGPSYRVVLGEEDQVAPTAPSPSAPRYWPT